MELCQYKIYTINCLGRFMKLIPLKGKYGEGKFAKVDDEDFDKLKGHSWYVNEGYVLTYHKGKRIRMHHLIMDAPKGKQVDHIHHDRLDHRKRELRLCTQRQNNANVQTRSESGYRNVSRDKTTKNSWKASISVDGKMVHLGNFKTPHLAALVVDLWLVDLHGEFAQTNFPIIASET